ncbi:hypothetical protein BEWA_022180 [Theileria equi strain WA]|uniref:Uncharacterized protein n=1 Tax=Theileria equi strain WA TaxID=1537102 RepID=L0AV06_THEEQ|nr:hypothetical protein BEWA_022180 [Theileria equi strain WA]AFZ79370.1 hypothetical protein BEWA_022180 [Theileria equi strain WA]|eukprot:XP_004829036.1 hypothetical protein BEWA_022180 [Theileria equi strain WA]
MFPKEGENSTSLDITSVKEDDFKVTEDLINGIRIKTFFPNDGIFVTRVLDSGTLTWDGVDDEECTSCVIYTRGGFACLLELTIKTETSVRFAYFEKKGGNEWKRISETSFSEKFDKMEESYLKRRPINLLSTRKDSSKESSLRGSQSEDETAATTEASAEEAESAGASSSHPPYLYNEKNTSATLDLANVDKYKTYVYDTTYNGLTLTSYRARDNVHFNKVVDGNIPIWEAQEGDKGILCEYYSEVGYFTLFLIRYKSGDSYYFKYYVKENDIWISIDKKAFYNRLNFLNF